MRRIRVLLRWITRRLALGHHLQSAVARYDRAADDLDAAVKEVLGR